MKYCERLILLCVLLLGCEDVFEFSPNQTFDRNSPVNLNQQNIIRLQADQTDDTITIAFVGDCQRFYDEVTRFVDKVNAIQSIDFVLLAGDISDFGLLEEFEQIENIFSRLEKPYIGVVGNHDVQAKGEQTFERMFGPVNFSFIYDSVKFIAHNTNGREYPPGLVPDMQWLTSQFTDEPGIKRFVTLSHIPPFDKDFDETLATAYSTLFREHHVLISLHGHVHRFKDGYPYNDGIRYMTSHSFDKRSFVVLKIAGNDVSYSLVDY
ncbi:MAG TPA: metallophosphoesterase [Chryseosolibacter sp.]|nr:metallophosphoesterase [Chryseosolibacter sp.]